MLKVLSAFKPKNKGKLLGTLLIGLIGISTLSSCASMTPTQQRVLSGAGIGAVGGAVVGAVTSGNPAAGAVVGGAVGAGIGAAAGALTK